jgi:predicted nucleic acid-binding protein
VSPVKKERRQIQRIIDALPFIPMDVELSQRAGCLLGESGNSVGKGDAAVAAAAEREGEPVLTRNLEDFENLGVAVESY